MNKTVNMAVCSLVIVLLGCCSVYASYQPVSLPNDKFNADGGTGWFSRSKATSDLTGMPTGTVTLGGIPWNIRASGNTPAVIMLGGAGSSTGSASVTGIPLNATATELLMLHAYNPGPALGQWHEDVATALGRDDTCTAESAEKNYPTELPPFPPILFKYVIRYGDGTTLEVGIRPNESIDDWLRNGDFLPPPFSDTVVVRTNHRKWVYSRGYPRLGERIVLYAFRFRNPYPARTVTSIDMVSANTAGKDWGSAALLALTVHNDPDAHPVYYVSPDGSDSDAGTFDSPWKTLGKGNGITPGASVFIRGGIYKPSGRVEIIHHNENPDGKWWTYTGFPGETAIFDGSDFSTNGDDGFIQPQRGTHLVFQNIWVRNSQGSGIRPWDRCAPVIIRNCTIFMTRGPGIWSTDSGKVLGNTLIRTCCTEMNGGEKNPREQIECGADSYYEVAFNEACWGDKEGVDINGGKLNRIHHNYIHHTMKKPYIQGLLLNSYQDNWEDCRVYNNIIHHTGNAICVGSEGGTVISDITIRNNICHNNLWSGIAVGSVGGFGDNVSVENNTCYRNGFNGISYIGSNTLGDMREVSIRNNICSENARLQLEYPSNLTAHGSVVEYNLVQYPPDKLRANPWVGAKDTLTGTHGIVADPLFMNASIGDFRLRSSSPALNAGTPDAAYNDPDGTRNDIGAVWLDNKGSATFASSHRRNKTLIPISNQPSRSGSATMLFDLHGRMLPPGSAGAARNGSARKASGVYILRTSDGRGEHVLMRDR